MKLPVNSSRKRKNRNNKSKVANSSTLVNTKRTSGVVDEEKGSSQQTVQGNISFIARAITLVYIM